MFHFLKLLLKAIDNDVGTMSVEEVAEGFLAVANEAMSRPIRNLTQARGYDPSSHVLACFGGAGGQHACDVARSLGIKKVIIHKYSSILSAYGMALADVVHEESTPYGHEFATQNFAFIQNKINQLIEISESQLESDGFSKEQIQFVLYLNMRYDRTDCALMVHPEEENLNAQNLQHFAVTFAKQYQREFGFTLPDRKIIVDDIRVRATAQAVSLDEQHLDKASGDPEIEKVTNVYFAESRGYEVTKVYNFSKLRTGHTISGPAIILDKNTTVLVKPGCVASVSVHGSIVIDVGERENKDVTTSLDPIQLAVFGHRFMGIAEQMGRVLQRTAISTNIKERLDFSCALFGPDGGLVSNAPHIPVHLGAMQEAVQFQMNELKGQLNRGDVILSNHPKAGGSHLPDLTVITPVFLDGNDSPVFFVANRGHHADIGGLTPGSMPSNSTTLDQEGAVFKCFKLVKRGVFQEEELIEKLKAPAEFPGCSGSRNLNDNLADLHAQIAANQKGIDLVLGLIKEYTLEVVQAYMAHIQTQAESAVRDLLKSVAKNNQAENGICSLYAEDQMDDGSFIRLKITINPESGESDWNFGGTSPQVWGNLNTPRAITLSAIIYCLRSMVEYDIPLNQGCLKPVHLMIPKFSLLDPDEKAAVVGANVLTSQRIVDVVLKAFRKCAASQGCMNNITFGNDDFGYYETVAGGAGAGPSWHGRSGVHTHMTNTRITDPEILEKRYPIILRTFSMNPGSGGNGKFRGGNGVIRELVFRVPMTLSVLTERRVFRPYGLEGGEPGASGQNLLVRENGQLINIGAKNAIPVQPGDCFRLLTPGGGGYGTPDQLAGSEVDRSKNNLRDYEVARFQPDS